MNQRQSGGFEKQQRVDMQVPRPGLGSVMKWELEYQSIKRKQSAGIERQQKTEICRASMTMDYV